VYQGLSGVRVATLLVTHPRWEPYAVMPLVRFCAGGDQRWSSLPRHLAGIWNGIHDLSGDCRFFPKATKRTALLGHGKTSWAQSHPIRGPILRGIVSAESRDGPTPHRLLHRIVTCYSSGAVAKGMEVLSPSPRRAACIFSGWELINRR
jgi:hypothetical protein